jgi:hypothetical protein
MNVVKVKFNIDIDNEQQLECFNTFVKALKGVSGTQPTIEAPVKDIRSAVAPVAQQAAAQTAPVAATPDHSTGSKKLDAIRKLIAMKAGTHREAMKAKLAELGAPTATDLTVDKYDIFHTFLENLA